MSVKTCTKCKTTKPISEFHRQKSAKDGHNWWCKVCNGRYVADRYRLLDHKTVRARNLMKNYGLTVAAYDALLAGQGGVCAICGRPPDERHPLHVDHCHATGRVRGILCSNCNLALGNAGDDPARLRAMAEYLEG